MKTTASNQTILEVPLDNGTCWRGTEAELRRDHPTWLPYAVISKSSVLTQIEAMDFQNDSHPTRLPNSSINYQRLVGTQGEFELQPQILKSPIPRRRSAQPPGETEEIPRKRKPNPNPNHAQPPEVIHVGPHRQKRRWSIGFFIVLGMCIMFLLWLALTSLASWWQVRQQDSTYGYPRTWQTNAVVGHNGDSPENPSHFIFINYNAHIEVIEFPAGDASKAKIYLGPIIFTDGGNLVPITGEFADVNGDGKPDMIINIQNSRIVFINENGQFRPQKPGERVNLPPQ